jgi:hypothetical protein
MKTSIKSLTLILALSLCQIAVAQKSSFTPEHEFRLGIGAYPLAESLDYLYNKNDDYLSSYIHYELNSSIYEGMKTYYGPKTFTGSISAGYTFNVLRWLSVGATFTYAGSFQKEYDRITNQALGRFNSNHLYFMPIVRFTYLNLPLIRLYSQVGAGASYVSYQHTEKKYNYTEKGISAQVTIFGISVGKQLFGFTELLGTGVQGSLVVGVGYRFNAKNR